MPCMCDMSSLQLFYVPCCMSNFGFSDAGHLPNRLINSNDFVVSNAVRKDLGIVVAFLVPRE